MSEKQEKEFGVQELIAVLSLFPQSKGEIAKLANEFDQLIEEKNPLSLLVYLKRAESLIKELLSSKLKDEAVSEAMLFPKGDDSWMGATFRVTSRSSYSFKHDSLWRMYDGEAKKWGKAKKGREAFLKELIEPTPDPETGEMVEPAQKTPLGSSVSITLPK